MEILYLNLFTLLGYILGSIPFGFIFTQLRAKKDIRSYGSGNIGSSNVARVLGIAWGLLTVLCDMLKAFLPLLLLKLFFYNSNTILDNCIISCVGMAIILGHIFSIFLKFRGGKGVATFIGMMLALFPMETLIYLGLYVLLLFVTRYTSLSSMISVGVFPIILLLVNRLKFNLLPYLIMTISLAIIIILKHKDNISRLKNGTESKFSFKKKDISTDGESENIRRPNKIRERGGILGRAFLHFMAKKLGMWSLAPFAPFIVFYFVIALGAVRRNLMKYWSCVRPNRVKFKYLLYIYRQFFEFSISLIERIVIQESNFEKYLGKNYENVENLRFIRDALKEGKGVLLLCSHIGGYSLYRFLLGFVTDKPVHIFMYGTNEKYSFVSKENSAAINFIDPTKSVSSMFQARRALENGELVVIMGDRIDEGVKRFETVDIANMKMKLPEGPFHLVKLSNAIAVSLFIVKENGSYKLIIKEPIKFNGDKTSIQDAIKKYAKYIEEIILKYPFQWYNFASKVENK